MLSTYKTFSTGAREEIKTLPIYWILPFSMPIQATPHPSSGSRFMNINFYLLA